MTFPRSQEGIISYGPLDYGPNWIIETLPYMEEQALHDSFNLNVKINDPAATSVNRIARGSMISVLLCPSDSENNRVLFGQVGRGSALGDNWARTNYAGNAGRADFWATEDPAKKR